MEYQKFVTTMLVNVVVSCVAFYVTFKLIPGLSDMFVRKNMFGIDMSKTCRTRKV